MLRLISLIILILLLAAPVFGLSLQEQMDLIKQQEQTRRAQIQQKHDADKPKPAPIVRTQKVTPVQPEAKVAETREPEPALVSDVVQAPSQQQKSLEKKNDPTAAPQGLMADQLWQSQRDFGGGVTQFRLFIDVVTDEDVSAILNITNRSDKQLYVLKGSYDRTNGKFDLRTVDRLSRTYEQPQIVGKLSGDNQALNTIFHFARTSPEIELKLISGADAEIRDVLEPARKTLQAKAEQQRQRDYYQALVITPELDEYGLKTLETVKLEREKQLLRPLSAEEYERVKTDHQQAIAQRQQQLEAERAHKAQMEVREKEALALRQQLEAERAHKAQMGAFTYSLVKDPFTDKETSLIYTVSQLSGRKAVLVLQCRDKFLIFYKHDAFIVGDNGQVQVRYRIDNQPAYGPSYWKLSGDSGLAFMPMNDIREFTTAARAGAKILIEMVDPVDGERLTDTFSLNGLSDALQKLPCVSSD